MIRHTSPPSLILNLQMMYRSKPCLPFFSSIVKNVASPNIEIKKLVYIYLLHYAESEPDLALLSINTIQKSLTDQNPQVRALALRVMSGIRVPVISQIVSLAIKRGCGDMSPYVRKAAALAIPKCYRLDPNTSPQLLEYISTLLGDKQYFVVGSAVTAFLEVCPDRIDLIHKHYRALVRKLVDMDEWGQLATLRLMIVYARKCFPQRTKRQRKGKSKSFYEDEAASDSDDPSAPEIQVVDPDLELLLKACKPLLQSRNSAVIVSVARCYLYLGTPEYLDTAIGPLIALLRGPQDIQSIAIYNIVSVCLVRPLPFARYLTHFLLKTGDPAPISRLKLEVLTLLYPHTEPHLQSLILSELTHFLSSPSPLLTRASVRAIGRCAQSSPSTARHCLHLLLSQVSSQDDHLVSESLTVIRHLIQQNPSQHTKTVIRLAKNLDTTTNPHARASIIWLVGEFSHLPAHENIAPDVLRILTKGFAEESEAAKLQIILLAAKVYLHHLLLNPPPPPSPTDPTTDNPFSSSSPPHSPQLPEQEPDPSPIPKLWTHILHLTRYDTSYDLRDRCRLYKALLANPHSTQLASLLLLAPKPVPHDPSPSSGSEGLLLGSASLVLGIDGDGSGGSGLAGHEALPEWVKEGEEPDPKLRDEKGEKAEYGERRAVPAGEKLEQAVRAKGPVMTAMGKEKTLDDWLDEEEEEEEEGSEEESGSTESESESEEEEEESEDEGEKGRLVR